MTYLYNISTSTNLLEEPIVKAIESSIPGPVDYDIIKPKRKTSKAMIEYHSKSEEHLVATRRRSVTRHCTFTVGGQNGRGPGRLKRLRFNYWESDILDHIENFKNGRGRVCVGPMRSMNIDVYTSTTELARESGIASG